MRPSVFSLRSLCVLGALVCLTVHCEPSERVDLTGPGKVITADTSSRVAGARLDVPPGAYLGISPLTIAEGEAPSDEGLVSSRRILSRVGPAVKMGPAGTQFTKSVTLALPFSVTAYNEAASADTGLAVLVQDEGGVVRLDVGPVNLEYVSLDVGPVNLVGLDVGPVNLTANEAGGSSGYDGLFEFQVDHFTTFQVVIVSAECEPQCNGQNVCEDDGCGGFCPPEFSYQVCPPPNDGPVGWSEAPTCADRCGLEMLFDKPCDCHSGCVALGSCCEDFCLECSEKLAEEAGVPEFCCQPSCINVLPGESDGCGGVCEGPGVCNSQFQDICHDTIRLHCVQGAMLQYDCALSGDVCGLDDDRPVCLPGPCQPTTCTQKNGYTACMDGEKKEVDCKDFGRVCTLDGLGFGNCAVQDEGTSCQGELAYCKNNLFMHCGAGNQWEATDCAEIGVGYTCAASTDGNQGKVGCECLASGCSEGGSFVTCGPDKPIVVVCSEQDPSTTCYNTGEGLGNCGPVDANQADTCEDGAAFCKEQKLYQCEGGGWTITLCEADRVCASDPIFGAYCKQGPEGCVPDCTNQSCGGDGCGGSCGKCPDGTDCQGDGNGSKTCQAIDACEQSACKGNIFDICVDGEIQHVNCANQGLKCLNDGAGLGNCGFEWQEGVALACTDMGNTFCDGNTLVICNGSDWLADDCTDGGTVEAICMSDFSDGIVATASCLDVP